MLALFFHYLIYALTVLNKILRKSCRHMRMTSSPFLLDSAYWKRIFRRWDSSCYSCCNTFGRALLEKQLICSNVFHAIGFFMYPLKTSSFAVSFNSIKISGVKCLREATLTSNVWNQAFSLNLDNFKAIHCNKRHHRSLVAQ